VKDSNDARRQADCGNRLAFWRRCFPTRDAQQTHAWVAGESNIDARLPPPVYKTPICKHPINRVSLASAIVYRDNHPLPSEPCKQYAALQYTGSISVLSAGSGRAAGAGAIPIHREVVRKRATVASARRDLRFTFDPGGGAGHHLHSFHPPAALNRCVPVTAGPYGARRGPSRKAWCAGGAGCIPSMYVHAIRRRAHPLVFQTSAAQRRLPVASGASPWLGGAQPNRAPPGAIDGGLNRPCGAPTRGRGGPCPRAGARGYWQSPLRG